MKEGEEMKKLVVIVMVFAILTITGCGSLLGEKSWLGRNANLNECYGNK